MSRRRAMATLAGVQGRRTMLDFLTSRVPAPDAAAMTNETAASENAPSTSPGNRHKTLQ